MKATKFVPVFSSLVIASVATVTPALADTESGTGINKQVAPISNAFEIAIGTGYSQGGGDIGGGMGTVEDVASAGAALALDVGYRITPNLMIGAYGTLAGYDQGDRVSTSTSVSSATAGIQAAVHLRPHAVLDPWISLGTGWKGLWLAPDEGKTTSLQGLELARLQVGADYRVSPDIAISPVLGASMSMYLAQDSAMTIDHDELTDKEVNFTFYAGLAGRFDLGGDR